MKNEELKSILEDGTLDVAAKIAKIQALNGVDIKVQQDKKTSEIDVLKAQFDADKRSWETEKSKYKDYVSKDDHQKVLDELQGFKDKEENGRRTSYLSQNLKVKKGYEDLVSSKIDWSKASYDESKRSYVGDEFSGQFESLKKQYPDLFESEGDPIPQKGYYGSAKQVTDLTDL
ncbi:MAG: hypothetical protein NC310_00320 [Roseburia sp.]|nr:hypothetical protein [Anaeroplasma bactoclasticum]MCM1195497.1 hypothetical protein [Roseburia sp.]